MTFTLGYSIVDMLSSDAEGSREPVGATCGTLDVSSFGFVGSLRRACRWIVSLFGGGAVPSHLKILVVIAIFGLALLAACSNGGNPTLNVTVEPGKVTCEPLGLFDSYRFHSIHTLELEELDPSLPESDYERPGYKMAWDVEGAVEGTDRVEALISYPLADWPNLGVVAIGETYWRNVVNRWTEESGPQTFLYEPLSLCSSLAPDLDLNGLTGEPDAVGEVEARRYHFDALPSDFAKRSEYLGPGSDAGSLISDYEVDVWVAEEGSYLVGMDITGVGTYENGRKFSIRFFYEVEDINDKGIQIVPPDI